MRVGLLILVVLAAICASGCPMSAAGAKYIAVSTPAKYVRQTVPYARQTIAGDSELLAKVGAWRLGELYVESTKAYEELLPSISATAAKHGGTHFMLTDNQARLRSFPIWPGQEHTTASAQMVGSSAYGSSTTTYTPPIVIHSHMNIYVVTVLYVSPENDAKLPWMMRVPRGADAPAGSTPPLKDQPPTAQR